jgi:hypothetical protein
MPHRDAAAICRKIDAALDYIGDDEDQMRPYLMHQIEQIMDGPKHIGMEDCTTSELMSLLAVLAPVFSRRLIGDVVCGAPPMEGKLLTLIIGDGGVRGESPTGT